MKPRASSNPKRRVLVAGALSTSALAQLAEKAVYVGSGHHKRYPADYGFGRVNPVPTKSLCDAVETILIKQAQVWLHSGIMLGMVSDRAGQDFPKYVWCVAENGVVYEAKTHPNTPGQYHGYPLEPEDDMREYIKNLWNIRCKNPGE